MWIGEYSYICFTMEIFTMELNYQGYITQEKLEAAIKKTGTFIVSTSVSNNSWILGAEKTKSFYEFGVNMGRILAGK